MNILAYHKDTSEDEKKLDMFNAKVLSVDDTIDDHDITFTMTSKAGETRYMKAVMQENCWSSRQKS